MQVSIDDAAQSFRELIEAVRSGEDIVLTMGGERVARLVPLPRVTPFPYDLHADDVKGPIPDFLEPMEEDELALWEGLDENRL